MKLFKRTVRDADTGELQTVSDNWWYRFELGGHVFTASTKLSNHKEAIKVATAARNQAVLEKAGLAAPAASDVPTLVAFTKQFLNFLQPRVAQRTFGFYVDAWQHIMNHRPLADARITDVDSRLVDSFVQARLAEKPVPSATTVNHSLRTLRRALHVAEELKIVAKAPKIRLIRGERSRDFVITETGLQKLLDLCKPEPAGKDWKAERSFMDVEMAPLMAVLYDTGIRLGEAVRLEWRDVSLDGRGHVHIRHGKSANAQRYIPLTARAKATLTALRPPDAEPNGRVFTRNGKPITNSWASHWFTWGRRKLGLPNGCVLHSMRHSYLTRLGGAGADAFTIQKLAGHATIQQSSKYVHPSEARLESTVALLDA